MRYIKLFESFESSKINKTLSFLNKESKVTFLNRIKSLCSIYDLPESKLNDELFEYLPYNKAISYNGDTSNLIDCPKCDDGKVEKKYGKGTRKVKCTTCKGEGKIEPKSELILVKFWFNKDGEYLAMTGVDGIYRELNLAGNETSAFSKDINDYNTETERIPKSRMNDLLNTGDIVKLSLINRRWNGAPDIDGVIAFVLRHNNKLWAIQNSNSYHYDYIYNADYNKYGTQAWQMTAGSIRSVVKLTPKASSDTRHPLGYNTQLDDKFKISQVGISQVVKDANFAIVLDLNKLKGIESKKTDIKDNRKVSKEGATALLSDVDIKTLNLNRYFTMIKDRSKLVGNMDDVKNFHRIITRLTGGKKYTIYNLLHYNFLISTPYDISTYVLRILRGISRDGLEAYISSDDFKYNVDSANTSFEYGMNAMLRNGKDIEKKIEDLGDRIKSNDGLDSYNRFLTINELVGKLSATVYNYISSKRCECLEDVSILLSELQGLKSLIASNISRDIAIGNWSSYSNYRSMCNSDSYYEKVEEELNYCISIVNRKIELGK